MTRSGISIKSSQASPFSETGHERHATRRARMSPVTTFRTSQDCAQPTLEVTTARSTPLTNAGDSSVESSETSWTASDTATASGIWP